MVSTVRGVVVMLGVVAAGSAGSASAQSSICPPGLKQAAGACVRTCPGGYEDRGDTCIYRNQSR